MLWGAGQLLESKGRRQRERHGRPRRPKGTSSTHPVERSADGALIVHHVNLRKMLSIGPGDTIRAFTAFYGDNFH